MTTKTATVTESTAANEAFLSRMKARVEDTSMRRSITSFATAYFNSGNNIGRMGLEINQKDLVRCQWKHEVSKDNADKYGYKLGKTKRGNSTDETIYFPEFHAYIVDMSAKLIEFIGVKSDDPKEKPGALTLSNGVVLNPYDRVGVIYNTDGTKGTEYDLYNDLRKEYPGCFTSRRFLMILLADAEGNTLHDIPLMLSIKGGALRYFDDAMIAVQSRMGMMVSELNDVQDASPLSIKGLRGFLLKFECEEGTSDNGNMSSPVTAVARIGAEINTTNAVQYFFGGKEEACEAWAAANPDFISAYDSQIGAVFGRKIRASLEASTSDFLLPEQTFTEVA
jgi:hypothetical protein